MTDSASVGRTAVLYVRMSQYSTVDEVEQIGKMLEWCAEHDVAVARIFRDDAKPGDTGRVGLDELIGYAMRRRPDILLAWSVDTLYDGCSEIAGLNSLCRDCGMSVVLASSDLEFDNPDGGVIAMTVALLSDTAFRRDLLANMRQCGGVCHE